jgi:hypothetical protein
MLRADLNQQPALPGVDRNPRGSERLTRALPDRLTHHVNILEMNGDSAHLKQSKHKRRPGEYGVFRFAAVSLSTRFPKTLTWTGDSRDWDTV